MRKVIEQLTMCYNDSFNRIYAIPKVGYIMPCLMPRFMDFPLFHYNCYFFTTECYAVFEDTGCAF